jgi:F-type H+-transporting ATPase subunit a
MEITPDHLVLLRWGVIHLNATIAYTWALMILLVLAAWLGTRRIRPDLPGGRWQNALEAIVLTVRGQVREISGQEDAAECIPFVGTLFLFIAVSNVLEVVPGWHPPTGSLSTTTALAICVAVSVPIFGIRRSGLKGYLHHYLTPNVLMAPFHLLSEFTRTVALAARLFGNIMSGSLLVALLLSITPFFVPVTMQVLGLLIGLIQAYIFSILAMVYIAAGLRSQSREASEQNSEGVPAHG